MQKCFPKEQVDKLILQKTPSNTKIAKNHSYLRILLAAVLQTKFVFFFFQFK